MGFVSKGSHTLKITKKIGDDRNNILIFFLAEMKNEFLKNEKQKNKIFFQ